MNRLLFLATAACAAALAACESELASDVSQDRIYTAYELFYDANDDITRARATFFLGSATGTRLELTDGAAVSFEGEELAWRPALAFYELELAGFRREGRFSYTDLDGETYVNPAAVATTDLPEALPAIARDRAYEIAWDGPPLGERESVVITVLTREAAGGDGLFTEASRGATRVILPADDVNRLLLGPAEVILARFEDADLSEGTNDGGKVTSHYRAPVVETVVE